MLLKFKFKNYKSFVEETTFSMMPAPKQTGLDYSVLKEKAGTKNHKALCSAVIYGPNAAGKTNIIAAMETLKAIVSRGNILNSDSIFSSNAASTVLELIPNSSVENVPTKFSISFIENNLLIKYDLSIDLGSFLEVDYKRKILEESLTINEKNVYKRNEVELEISLPSCIKSFLNKGIKNISSTTEEIARNSLSETELFLTNGFKTIFAQDLVSLILNWFANKFIVIYRSDTLRIMNNFAKPTENSVYTEKTLNEAAIAFGINSNGLKYVYNNENKEPLLCSVFDDKNINLPAELYESYGTLRFISEFPLVIKALLNGCTLVMDEFDASIHPMALMNVISIFHNDNINKNNAQLIFNTHNPIFLDSSLFRRDEIKFVERDEKTNYSHHYSLSDFKTADGIRKGEDYMSKYFLSRYGAIKDVDFSPILEKLINERNGE
ncbi:MAG: ATP-binding protein [Erysipelotrichaceae bacterium]|uniref:AAA family ATPase n=1 Tax=Clostridium sp. TaxID=1506 RepID=UPI002A752A94|nr:ATP-binding protein [Clostridium sp.]MCI6696289.1 ATP-binding protein [Solobacterium sp.]MDY2632663.1 ATP-binding protein [Clostridium sp.]MDY2639319.1 ATP-binding protein [Ligilactobacillus salivarius]MDY3793909.1 ATP-binding protein [Erysipelotrichaceae bacterium]